MDTLTRDFQRAVDDELTMTSLVGVASADVEINRNILCGTSTLRVVLWINGERVVMQAVIRDDSVGCTPEWNDEQIREVVEALINVATSP